MKENPMYRLLAAFIAAGSMAISPALAAGCPSAGEQASFDVAALKSELMVLATNCRNDSDYNAVVNRFRPQLVSNDAELNVYFKRVFGASAQREHDAYITALANAQAEEGIKLGSDLCPRDTAIFHEVMTLPDGKYLAPYAAAKELFPTSLGPCVEPPPPAPRARVTHTAEKHTAKPSH
jgi:hypothetical protein